MAKQNGKVPGTFVSEKELNELGNLLSTMRDYILSHEARIELVENWINEFHQHNATTEDVVSDDARYSTDKSESEEKDELLENASKWNPEEPQEDQLDDAPPSQWENEGGTVTSEPTDDSEEG